MGCCGSCLRCIVATICMPFLLIISLFGCLIWLILLPFKLPCCCCIGCCAQCIVDVVETLVKAPFKICMWVTDEATGESSKSPV